MKVPRSPGGMPDFRSDVVDWIFAQQEAMAAKNPEGAAASLDSHDLSAALNAGDLWWVDEQSADLVAEMAIGVPPDLTWSDSMFPAFGFAAFAKPLAHGLVSVPNEDGCKSFSPAVLSWYCHRDLNSGSLGWSVLILGYTRHAGGDVLLPVKVVTWDEGDPMPHGGDQVIHNREFQWLVALMALAKEPRLATTTDEEPDRASRRRAKRAGIDLGATRVIYARPSSGTSGATCEGHAYKHRWIVSGHWRSQPYGEGMKLRRPVYIAPHVKGPDGAPLLHGEKVRAIVGDR